MRGQVCNIFFWGLSLEKVYTSRQTELFFAKKKMEFAARRRTNPSASVLAEYRVSQTVGTTQKAFQRWGIVLKPAEEIRWLNESFIHEEMPPPP